MRNEIAGQYGRTDNPAIPPAIEDFAKSIGGLEVIAQQNCWLIEMPPTTPSCTKLVTREQGNDTGETRVLIIPIDATELVLETLKRRLLSLRE